MLLQNGAKRSGVICLRRKEEEGGGGENLERREMHGRCCISGHMTLYQEEPWKSVCCTRELLREMQREMLKRRKPDLHKDRSCPK